MYPLHFSSNTCNNKDVFNQQEELVVLKQPTIYSLAKSIIWSTIQASNMWRRVSLPNRIPHILNVSDLRKRDCCITEKLLCLLYCNDSTVKPILVRFLFVCLFNCFHGFSIRNGSTFGFIYHKTDVALFVSQAYKCLTSKISFTY